MGCRKTPPLAWTYDYQVLPQGWWWSELRCLPAGDTCYLAGGQRYGEGGLMRSVDGGRTWQPFFEYEREIRFLALQPPHRLWFCGLGWTLFHSPNAGQDLAWPNLPGWEYWLGGQVNAQGKGFIVSGEGFGVGYLQRFNPDLSLGQRDTLAHSLRAAYAYDEQTAYILGYGLVSRSGDMGDTWTVLPEFRGDFFTAMHFPDPQHGFVCGQYGSFYRSTDGGQSWTRLHKARSLQTGLPGIQGLVFRNAQEGIRVGGQGLIELSRDGGESWQALESPQVQWRGCYYQAPYLWIYGSKGEILRAEWNF